MGPHQRVRAPKGVCNNFQQMDTRPNEIKEALNVAKAKLGAKRICPDTDRKFYDLNRDPIISPYTGKSWPLSYFEETSTPSVMDKAKDQDADGAEAENAEIGLMPMKDGGGDNDDSFLETDDDDMSGILNVSGDGGDGDDES